MTIHLKNQHPNQVKYGKEKLGRSHLIFTLFRNYLRVIENKMLGNLVMVQYGEHFAQIRFYAILKRD